MSVRATLAHHVDLLNEERTRCEAEERQLIRQIGDLRVHLENLRAEVLEHNEMIHRLDHPDPPTTVEETPTPREDA